MWCISMCASAVLDSQLIWKHRWWFHCHLEVVVVVVGWWLVVIVFVVADGHRMIHVSTQGFFVEMGANHQSVISKTSHCLS